MGSDDLVQSVSILIGPDAFKDIQAELAFLFWVPCARSLPVLLSGLSVLSDGFYQRMVAELFHVCAKVWRTSFKLNVLVDVSVNTTLEKIS